ncbi:putative inorganic phosphate cotransporter [Phymastichus coffea]|uniref:putative inorganic phosphate cotransporter n=1 Tax=Phymastichus coffea TaxID=108790 RepID=UPI00273C4CE2|nr:putative inorganic phosphate cotransporter [Phymastichus coffea]
MTVPISEPIIQGDNDFNNTFLRNLTSNIYMNDSVISEKRYDWDEYTQGVILSAFYWGYAFTQPFYGSLSEKYGGKYFLGLSIFIPSVISFFTPILISWGGSMALICTRVISGIANGAMYPVSNTMVSQWTTPNERTKIVNAIYTGASLGLFLGIVIPGLIIKYSDMGWAAVFYLFGTIGIIWFPTWTLFVYNNPPEHPFISQEEREYLKPRSSGCNVLNELPSTPWKNIIFCKEFWAFTMGLIGNSWAFFAMITDLPKYMSSVVKFSIDSNSYFSALPYLTMCIVSTASTWINDKMIEKQWISVTNARKLFASFSLTGPAVFIILASFAGCNKILVVVMFMTGISIMGCINPSIMMSPLDLSPNYAGTFMALGNGISSVVGIIVPYIIGILTPNQTIEEWRIVFWIVFFFSVGSNAIYILWFSAKIKDWDDPSFNRNQSENKKNEYGGANVNMLSK